MEIKTYKVADSDGVCYKCKKQIMNECKCFMGNFLSEEEFLKLKQEKAQKKYSL